MRILKMKPMVERSNFTANGVSHRKFTEEKQNILLLLCNKAKRKESCMQQILLWSAPAIPKQFVNRLAIRDKLKACG